MKKILFILSFVALSVCVFAQSPRIQYKRELNGEVTSLFGGLHVNSTTQGLLIPRMTTTQRNAITALIAGLIIWNTTDSTLQEYRGLSGWSALAHTSELIKTGIAFFSGDGSATTFDITLPTTPSWANAEASSAAGSNITYRAPITNGIRIFYAVAPAPGTNNISISYQYK